MPGSSRSKKPRNEKTKVRDEFQEIEKTLEWFVQPPPGVRSLTARLARSCARTGETPGSASGNPPEDSAEGVSSDVADRLGREDRLSTIRLRIAARVIEHLASERDMDEVKLPTRLEKALQDIRAVLGNRLFPYDYLVPVITKYRGRTAGAMVRDLLVQRETLAKERDASTDGADAAARDLDETAYAAAWLVREVAEDMYRSTRARLEREKDRAEAAHDTDRARSVALDFFDEHDAWCKFNIEGFRGMFDGTPADGITSRAWTFLDPEVLKSYSYWPRVSRKRIGTGRYRETRGGPQPILRKLVEPVHRALLPFFQGEKKEDYRRDLMELLADLMTTQYGDLVGDVDWTSIKSTLEHCPNPKGEESCDATRR